MKDHTRDYVADLRNAQKTRCKIDQIKEQIEILRSAVEYGERIIKSGGSGCTKDKIGKIISRISELTDEMTSLAIDYDIDVAIAEQAISDLTEPQQKIARARYIDGLSWREVAEKTNYSESHCKNTNISIIRKVSTK